MASRSNKSVAELYAQYESLREQAKVLYDKADATLKNGVMKIVLPKSEISRAKQIKIRLES